ncbi:MAG: SEC-C metal-binding domain-containing protein [Pseudomonadota bacterium]
MKGGEKELVEKLGRNDPCPCGSGKSFQAVLPQIGALSMGPIDTIIGAIERAYPTPYPPPAGLAYNRAHGRPP